MNNIKKILVCVALISCFSMSAIGCNSTNSEEDSTSAEVSTEAGVDTDSADDNNVEVSDDADVSADEEDTTSADGEATEEDTTSDDGETTEENADETVEETVAVTDADGNQVTDSDGNVVTDIVIVNKNGSSTQADANNQANNNDSNNAQTEANANNSNDGNQEASTTTEDSSIYFAKNRYTTFLWMSNDTSNKYDSGAMAEVTFKVLDDAEVGDYSVEFNYVEIYDTNGEAVPFTVQNGTIAVGSDKSVTTQGAASSGVNYRIDNATAQPGDTVTLTIYLDNNTGMAITKVELKYDNKALEVQSVTSTGAFSSEVIESNLNGERSSRK